MMTSRVCVLLLIVVAGCGSSDEPTSELDDLRQRVYDLSATVDQFDDTDLTSLASRVTATEVVAVANGVAAGENSTSIDGNGAAILTNAGAITTNTTLRATNESALAVNNAAIATNNASLTTNVGELSTNTAAISTNTANIAANAAGIATNATSIATNAAGIATNAGNIVTNAASITTNTAAIATNAAVAGRAGSCLDILTGNPMATDGYYKIAPSAGTPEFAPDEGHLMVWCDMAGGGWTAIDFQDFNDGTAMGWSDPTVDTTSDCTNAPLSPMLGGYNNFGSNDSTSRTYPLYRIPHTEVRVTLDFIAIDDWTNVQSQVLFEGLSPQWFEPVPVPGPLCGDPAYSDPGAMPVVLTASHTSDFVTLTAGGIITNPTASWGIDNVWVLVR